MGSMMTLLDLP
jgi:hypothetical protein